MPRTATDVEPTETVAGRVEEPDQDTATPVHLRMHPRVFAALGADLVTNDIVAVIELVKNSYDAYANEVWVRLGTEGGEPYMEIEDDGHGMTEAVIRDVWCLIATPYKEHHREVVRDGATRRVSGEKGLGRLSVGRLGQRLTLLTKADGHPCWQVKVDWDDLAAGDNLDESTVELKQRAPTAFPHESGTLLRIHSLKSSWDDNQREELKHNLERLVSPFENAEDFEVHFAAPSNDGETTEITISSPHFLSEPKYWMRGEVDDQGNVNARYQYRAISTNDQRDQQTIVPWHRIYRSVNSGALAEEERDATCGPFSFDIRAWDISQDGTQEIAKHYRLQKRRIKAAIRANKGVSVYRDGVLVLPKSDGALDWLGLDLRRVSRVGGRLSTNQLVGYVSITAYGNPGIRDTSDRERLTASQEVSDFQAILRAVISELEKARDEDRAKDAKETPMEDLLSAVSATGAINEVNLLARAGQSASKAVPVLRSLERSLATTRKNIERRFIYYSRLATVGTVAQMLVHEIRNRTTAIGRFLQKYKQDVGTPLSGLLRRPFEMANNSVQALERLADVFSPLANQRFKRGNRTCVLEERIEACLYLQRTELQRGRISYSIPETRTAVAVDPAELDAIILNLVSNSVYWLSEAEADRRLEFQIHAANDQTKVSVRALDTGPGIQQEDMERVFWPGVTRKPDGIGMGLTVASELVAAYGGRMAIEDVDVGASFTFELPLVRDGGQ